MKASSGSGAVPEALQARLTSGVFLPGVSLSSTDVHKVRLFCIYPAFIAAFFAAGAGVFAGEENSGTTGAEGVVRLIYDFDDATFQGWTEVAGDADGRKFFAIVPPTVSSPNSAPHSGSYFVGLHIPAFSWNDPAYTQDSEHDTLWLRSPEFRLNGEGDLTVRLSGGGPGSPDLAGTSVGDLQASTTNGGFRGVALRDVSAGVFVLSGAKTGMGNDWERITFTEAELSALDPDAIYTLDLIDAGHGAWGWVNMDTVNIPGRPVDVAVIPSLGAIDDQAVGIGAAAGPVAIDLDPGEMDPGSFTFSAISSNSFLVPVANIVIEGAGPDWSVTVTPVDGREGNATIAISARSGTLEVSTSFELTVAAIPELLQYDFSDGTLQGWREIWTDGEGRQHFAIVPPSVYSPKVTPHSGAHFAGLHIPAFRLGDDYYTQDSEHETLLLRSPKFMLNDAGDLTVWLSGGGAGSNLPEANVSDLPSSSVHGGFRGVALRDVTTGTYVLSGAKTSNGSEWEEIVFTTAQLAALPRDHVYTLDLIDAAHGGWGWVSMDTVSIPGDKTYQPIGTGVVINEFTGNNHSLIRDEDGDYSDWVELFNAGGVPVNLDGYGLSDDLGRPFRWILPSVVLQPGERLLVWLSGKDRAPGRDDLRNGIAREVYNDIPGWGVADLLAYPGFPEYPSSRHLVNSFFEAPQGIGDFYGQRMHGHLRAPATGDYTFWIASNSASRLYLTDGDDIDYDSPIAYVPETGWTGWRQWNKFASEQVSAPVFLQEGELYYIVALMKAEDGADHLSVRWRLPDGRIEEPMSAKHVFTRSTELHANFSLSRHGEPLQLVDPNGNIVDAVGPVPLPPDISYGRATDGSDEWVYFANPTPGGPNDGATGYAGIVEPPAFSHTSGFYADPFALTLTGADLDVDIIYTLDGSEPEVEKLDGVSYLFRNQYHDGPLIERVCMAYVYTQPLSIAERDVPFAGIQAINTEISATPLFRWGIEGDEIVQYSNVNDSPVMFGDTSWTNYELTLEAMKTGGNEGFLIPFRVDGNRFYRLSLGWGTNTEHTIHKGDGNGGFFRLANLRLQGRSIQAGVWHNIRIRVEDARFRCWLDGELLFDHTDTSGSTNLAGGAGISTWSTQARFRNIQVESLSEPGAILFSGIPTRKTDVTLVRARAVREGYLPSEVVTQTFFLREAPGEGSGLPIISIATDEPNLFDFDRGIYVPGRQENYFQRGDEWERPAHVALFEPDGRTGFSQDAGFRVHGGVTRIFPQKSLRLYARSVYGDSRFEHQVYPDLSYTSFNRLLLRNSGNDNHATIFRDAMNQRLVEHMRFDTQAYRPSIVYINSEYWGLKNIRERYDRHYLARVHDVDPDIVDILEFRPAAPHSVKYGNDAHYVDTIDYINTHGLTDPVHYDHIGTRIDIENFIDFNVAQIFLNNTDWPNNNNDFWRKQRPEYDSAAPYGHDGRWRWMMFDTDFGFGLGRDASFDMLGAITQTEETEWWNSPHGTLLIRAFVENEAFQIEFVNRFADQLNSAFQPSRVIGIIDSMQAAIAPEIGAHIERWRRPWAWEAEVQKMRSFAVARPDHVRSHLSAKFDLVEHDLTVDVSDTVAGHVRVNTIDITGTTPGLAPAPYPWVGRYFDLPVTVTAIPSPGYRFSHWDGWPIPDEASFPALTFTLDGDRELTAVFEEMAEPLSLLHYWHFNNLPAGVVTEVSPDYGIAPGALITYTGTGPGYMDDVDGSLLNARDGVEAGRGLRVRNPADTRALEVAAPTAGYKDIVFSYAAMRTTNGAQGQIVEYRSGEGEEWIRFGGPLTIGGDYQVFSFDFSAVPEARDNPDFRIRIGFGGTNASGESGNNRLDNIVVTGIPLEGTIPPPVLIEPMESQYAAENAPLSIALDPHFRSHAPGGLTYHAWADKTGLVDFDIVDGNLTLIPLQRGEVTVTVTASDGVNPPIEANFRLLIYPEPYSLANGAFRFDHWDGDNPENTFPGHMLFLQSDLTDPGLEAALDHAYFIPTEDYHSDDSIGFPYNNTRRTRLNGLGHQGISFINTGRSRDLGGALVALDTTGVDSAYVSWIGGTVTPNSRVYSLRLQYRTSYDAPFADILDDAGMPVEYTRSTVAGHWDRIGPVALPGSALGQENLQLLWRYYFTGERLDLVSGARDELSLDNILVIDGAQQHETFNQWLAATYSSEELDDPTISGPDADPFGDGITNLMRYAFDIPFAHGGRNRLPRLLSDGFGLAYVFPYREGASDLAYIVRTSEDLVEWGEPLFDSRSDPIVLDRGGNVSLQAPFDGHSKLFLRVEILFDGH